MSKWSVAGAFLIVIGIIGLFDSKSRASLNGAATLIFIGLFLFGEESNAKVKNKLDMPDPEADETKYDRNLAKRNAAAFEPQYKVTMYDRIGIKFSHARHVGFGEHLCTCPKCGMQNILRNGSNSYPKGVGLVCDTCGHIYHIY